MYRHRLKSKTGCHRCKQRHKKCDERRPICTACKHHDMICTWNSHQQVKTVQKISDRTTTDEAQYPLRWTGIQRIPLSRNVSSGIPGFRNQTQFDLVLQFPKIHALATAPTANPEFMNPFCVMSVAFRDEGCRSAVAALSGFSLYASTRNPVFKQASLDNYQEAIISLRHSVSRYTNYSDKAALQLTSTYLGIVESSVLGDASMAAIHLAAAARVWSSSMYETFPHGSSLVQKIVAELWLFNLAISNMFLNFEQADHVMSCIDLPKLGRAFHQSSNPSLPDCAASPLLVLDHTLFRLILQITHFGRQSPTVQSSKSLRQLRDWSSELEVMESSLETSFADVSDTLAERFRACTLLYIYTLRILLYKISFPGACSSSPEIQFLFKQALKLLASAPIRENVTGILAWPLFILLCAAGDPKDFEFVCLNCASIGANNGAGRKFYRLERAVRKMRKDLPCSKNIVTCTGEHDGLGILLLKDSVTGLENDDDIHVDQDMDVLRRCFHPSAPRAWLWQRVW